MNDVINRTTYYNIASCIQQLKEELYYKYYINGKGNPPSASKLLRRYGFKDKRKDKLIRAAEYYLSRVEVV